MINYILIFYLIEILMWYIDSVLTHKLYENRLQYVILDNEIRRRGDKPTSFQGHEYFMEIYDMPREVNPKSNKKLKLTFKNIDFDNIAIVFLMPVLFPLLVFILIMSLILEQRNEFKLIFGGLLKIYSKKLKEIKILKEGRHLMEEELKEKKNVKESIYGETHEDFIKDIV